MLWTPKKWDLLISTITRPWCSNGVKRGTSSGHAPHSSSMTEAAPMPLPRHIEVTPSLRKSRENGTWMRTFFWKWVIEWRYLLTKQWGLPLGFFFGLLSGVIQHGGNRPSYGRFIAGKVMNGLFSSRVWSEPKRGFNEKNWKCLRAMSFYGGRPLKKCGLTRHKGNNTLQTPKTSRIHKVVAHVKSTKSPETIQLYLDFPCPTDSTKNQQPKPRPLQSQVNPKSKKKSPNRPWTGLEWDEPSPPSHFLPCRFNSGNKVAICRAPVAPKGCPRAMAPPLGFTSGRNHGICTEIPISTVLSGMIWLI